MKVLVANRDRTEDLGAEVSAQAALLARQPDAPETLRHGHNALFLNGARDPDDYLNRYIALLGARTGVSTLPFYVPHKPGAAGTVMAKVRGFLWKLLRYQHERIAQQQNLINFQLTEALRLMHSQYRRDVTQLQRRVMHLEHLLIRSAEPQDRRPKESHGAQS